MDPTPSASEQRQRRKLVVTRRAAGALLAFVTAVFVAVTLRLADSDSTVLGYVQAGAEAAMVGGLADWFAVTALFRHPLGVPIPHTAIIPERKDRFGETLGSFIADAFLTPDTVAERVRAATPASRASAWLSVPANADRVAGYVLDGAVAVLDFLDDDEVSAAIETSARAKLVEIELAPAAGRALGSLTAQRRHTEVVDAALRGVANYLADNEAVLRTRFEQSSPWWLPGAVEDRIFARLLEAARNVLRDMVETHEHQLRRHLDERIAALVVELQTSPELLARGEQLKADLLAEPSLGAYAASAWADLQGWVRDGAVEPDSALRRRVATTIAEGAARIHHDPGILASIDAAAERTVRFAVEHYADEFEGLVTSTIQRWDGEETASRLELLLGPDLQFIRINGTIVGGLAGLVLHAVAEAIG